MEILGFRQTRIDGDAHVQFYNPLFRYALRPARHRIAHCANAPGLQHLCLRVETAEDVRTLATRQLEAGIDASEPRLHPRRIIMRLFSGIWTASGWRSRITGRQRDDRWDET